MTEIRNLGLAARDQAATHPSQSGRVDRVVTSIEGHLVALSCDSARQADPDHCATVLREVNTQLTAAGADLQPMSNPAQHRSAEHPAAAALLSGV